MSGFEERNKKGEKVDFYGFEQRVIPVLFCMPVLLIKKDQDSDKIYMGEIFIYAENEDEFDDKQGQDFTAFLQNVIEEKFSLEDYMEYDYNLPFINVSLNTTDDVDVIIENGNAFRVRQPSNVIGPVNKHICMFKIDYYINTVGFPYAPGQKEIDFVLEQYGNIKYLGYGGMYYDIPDYQFVKLSDGEFYLFKKDEY